MLITAVKVRRLTGIVPTQADFLGGAVGSSDRRV